MIFDCGETHTEYMLRKRAWNKWFAWYPVNVGLHKCAWLCFVLRRAEWDFEDWHHEHREIT